MKPIKNKIKRKEYFKKHLKDMTYEEIAPVFGVKNGESVRTWAKRHNMPNKHINKQAKRATQKSKDAKLIALLKERGRTEQELKKLGYSFGDARKVAKKEKGYTEYIQRSEYNERVLVLIREINDKIEIKPRAFKYSIAENQPYLWTKFPYLSNDGVIDRLRIFPLADVHKGHRSCDKESFLQDVEYIKNNKNVYAIAMGDLIENASKLSIASGVYEQNEMPNEQIGSIVKILAPIAHKILFSIQGNHEERVYRHLGIDIGRLIAEKLDIPYFDEPVYVDLLWRDYRWTMFAQHGSSGAQTKGGKMNAASRPVNWTDFTNFYVYAHVHDKTLNEVPRIVRDPVNFRLLEKKQYVIVCSAYLKHFGTYGARKGYGPTSKGRIMFKLYSNGKYYIGN